MWRIFLAGASRVIGQRLIPRLVQAGRVVGGLTCSPSKMELLAHLGIAQEVALRSRLFPILRRRGKD